MSLLYTDGYFPFCIPSEDEEGNPFAQWDGETVCSDSVVLVPSASSDEIIPVYGNGSNRPLGLTLEQFAAAYWRVRRWEMLLPNADEVLVTADEIPTFSGGYYDGLTWVPDSASASASQVTVADLDLTYNNDERNVRGSDFGFVWDIENEEWIPRGHEITTCSETVINSNVYWAPWTDALIAYSELPNDPPPYPFAVFRYRAFDSHIDNQLGAFASTLAEFSFTTSTVQDEGLDVVACPFLFQDCIYADGKYWPLIGSFFFFGDNQRNAQRKIQSGPAPGTEWDVFLDEQRYCEAGTPGSNRFIVPGEDVVSVEFDLMGELLTFNLAVWSGSAEFFDMSVFSAFPTLKFHASKYWTYGGIYDEDTGEKV